MSANTPVDRFHHLHDERYVDAFAEGSVGALQIFMGGRKIHDLCGEWRFVLDLFDKGLCQKWYAHAPSHPTGREVPRDYDTGDWQNSPVPFCFNLQWPEWCFFECSAWWTKLLEPRWPKVGV